MKLDKIECKFCNQLLKSENLPIKIKKATSFDSCLRKCNKCNIGYSNGKRYKIIYKCPEQNIPQKLRNYNINYVLDNSLNKQHRKSKRNQFCSESSEDAITWTIFLFLYQQKIIYKTINEILKNNKTVKDNIFLQNQIYIFGVSISTLCLKAT